MAGQAGGQDIVPTSKFKSSKLPAIAKKQQEEVVDDWDAESSDDDASQVIGDKGDEGHKDVFKATKDQWTAANSQAPAPVPVIVSGQGRSLPEAAFGHRLEASAAPRNVGSQAQSSLPHGSVTIAAAPPRILQRPKEATAGMRSDGSTANTSNSANKERKTVEQRQEEYRLARERIFGSNTPDDKASKPRV